MQLLDRVQIAKSFDRVTLQKIGKGALIAAAGAIATYLGSNIELVGEAFKANPVLAIVATSVVSVLVNAVKEWLKGEKFEA